MKAALHNLGCKTNSYETEAMEQSLKKAGYEIVGFSDDEKADIYIINTCSVTNVADRKSRQMIHKARSFNPAAVVVAVGCFVQTSAEEDLKKEGIDICLGSNDKSRLIESIEGFLKDRKQRIKVSDIRKSRDIDILSVSEKPRHTRAFIKIEDGCDQFCSFCIIPYARGRVRSRAPEDIVSEAVWLSRQGVKEIVLTGINMSAYGSDLDPAKDLGDLLLALQKTDGIERIRVSSLEPRIVNRDFLEKIKSVSKLCPHFHLSLQSGSDSVLSRMNRHYTRGEYLSKCNLLREYYHKPSITTDIITGFPGETDEEFKETLRFVDSVDFFDIHVFAFSPRRGTPAASMPYQTQGKIKRLRSALLIQKAAGLKQRNIYDLADDARDAGESVLIEEKVSMDLTDHGLSETNFYVGHTTRYVKILIPETIDVSEGEIVDVTPVSVVTLSDGEPAIICSVKKTQD